MPMNLISVKTEAGPVLINPANVETVTEVKTGIEIVMNSGTKIVTSETIAQLEKRFNYRTPDGF